MFYLDEKIQTRLGVDHVCSTTRTTETNGCWNVITDSENIKKSKKIFCNIYPLLPIPDVFQKML